MPETLLKTPLFDEHVALGARMVPFAGYHMPVQYKGIIAESRAVREAAGMFDVSHMGRLWFRGEGAGPFLEWITANDISKLDDGRGQYSLLPNALGGTVDDIIVYRVNASAFRMVVNAANHQKDLRHIRSQIATFELRLDDRLIPLAAHSSLLDLDDETERTAMIAVQGPKAAAIVAELSDDPDAILRAPLFGLNDVCVAGVRCFAPRSGYTGEDGFELICAAEESPKLWRTLRDAGVTPCGLGARDTLRVEAGLPLYGHELTDDLSPIAAGLGWVISKTKSFIGSEHIAKARSEGTPRKIQGVKLESRRLISPGMTVFVEGNEVGEVTSGVYSPTLDCGIAFALIDSTVPLDSPCSVNVRGKLEAGRIVNKRFLRRA